MKNDLLEPVFDGCEWLTFPECDAAIARTVFTVDGKAENICRATLRITALGYFEATVNGKRVGTDRLVPAMSDYEKRDLTKVNMPIFDELSHRIYYLTYDVTPLLNDGENVLLSHVGAGWYGQRRSLNEGMPVWGDICLVFDLTVTDVSGNTVRLRSCAENTRWKESYIRETQLYFGEYHDMRLYDAGCALPGADFGGKVPTVRKQPEALLCETDFPTDRVITSFVPKKVYTFGDTKIYDMGKYAAGCAVIRFVDDAWTNDTATVRYADERNPDGSLNFHYCGGTARLQRDFFIYDHRCDVKELYAHFTWHAGRYIELTGKAEVIRFDVIQSDIRQISTFKTDNETLNWIFDAYVRTQTTNIHGCVPSDCPHRERLGYTGDGQLTCGAVMSVFDSRQLYRKWMRDILDCQDIHNGHVQHTAPFYGGGGGPGGWGGAVCIVPYEYYLAYGDDSLLRESYDGMKRYISYMEAHSDSHIVTREEKGGWCLGDWCPPDDKIEIPESFVNTYFLIKCLDIVCFTAELFAQPAQKALYAEKAKVIRQALKDRFYDGQTGSFCGGVQGADAFAVDIGIADERTEKNLIEKYTALAHFDTGIFGTDILIRVLFEKGYPDLAFTLLTSEDDISFYHMKQNAATTLWENWNGCDSRCHPMFGAIVRYFFTDILGIRRDSSSGRYTVSPADIRALKHVEGSMQTPQGLIRVSITRHENGKREITVLDETQ